MHRIMDNAGQPGENHRRIFMKILDAVKTISLKKDPPVSHSLQTPWTSQALAGTPWQEYPRPQLKRDCFISLNGPWNYAFTAKEAAAGAQAPAGNAGMTFSGQNSAWQNSAWPDPASLPRPEGKIRVPFSPEAPLSGVGRQLLPGQTLWYSRSFQLDHIPEKQRLFLHFGAVDERCRVYVNGHMAGEHSGGYLPFSLEITKLIHEGENQLLVQCQDDSDQSYHSRGKQTLNRGGMFYTAQSGIWQTVWLEWVPQIFIEKIALTPHFDEGRIQIKVYVNGSTCSGESAGEFPGGPSGELPGKLPPGLHLTVRVAPASVQTASSPDINPDAGPDANTDANPDADPDAFRETAFLSTEQTDFSLVIPDFIPWTPDNPFLYDLHLTLQGSLPEGDIEDRVTSYFAMRCFTVEPDQAGYARLCLNHRPLFQNGVLDQGYWPDGLYTAPCDEAMVYDILAMKKAGFNMIRKHCKLEPLRWYYHCDRLGMLVWQDMVNGGSAYDMKALCYLPTVLPSYGSGPHDSLRATGRTEAASRREWYRECRDTIHYLYNSPCLAAWVLFNEGWGQFDTEKASSFARRLDPTRIIDAASGWFDHGSGDLRSVHNYFRRLSCPQTGTPTQKSPVNISGIRAACITEYGGLALPLPGHVATGRVYGYRNLKSLKEFRQKFAQLQADIDALKALGLSAAVYTQVSDIEDETNGILTYDRQVNKLDEPV